MQFTVITLFPEFVENLNSYSVIGRAFKNKKATLKGVNLRDFGLGKHKQVDDKPYGGGAGMLLRVDVVQPAIKSVAKRKIKSRKVVLLSADGEKFTQQKALEYSHLKGLVLICGHYEGHDKRIEDYVDEKISIGEYVVSGGEIPAMTIIDATTRLLPGVITPESLEFESFTISPSTSSKKQISDSLEYPQFTRPEIFDGKKVPEILLTGNHEKIKKWRSTL